MKTFFLVGFTLCVAVNAASANEPYLPRGEKALVRLDSNKDGRLSLDEIKPGIEKRLTLADANGDKQVTAAEIDMMLQKRIEKRRTRIMELLDSNRDGSISQAELDRVVEDMFDKADIDKNGGVDLAEMQGFKRGPWRKAFLGSK